VKLARAGARKPSRRVAAYALGPDPASAQASKRKPSGGFAAYAYAYATAPLVAAPKTPTLAEASTRKPSRTGARSKWGESGSRIRADGRWPYGGARRSESVLSR
jgi:hypothetical protein